MDPAAPLHDDAQNREDEAADSSRRRGFQIGCISVFVLLVAMGIVVSISMPSDKFLEQRENEAIAKTEKLGIAASLATFSAKYPSTEKGRAGAEEAARIVHALSWNYKDYENTSAPVELAPKSNFDLHGLITKLRGDSLSTSTLLAYYDANSTPVQELLQIHHVCSFEELSWTYNSFSESPLFVKQFLRMRETSRVLLPTSVWVALEDGDTTRAYITLLNWMYMGQSLKVASTSLVDGMVGVAVNGVEFQVLNELMRAAPPPSKEVALRLLEHLDPDRLRDDFLRTCEAEMIWMIQFLRFVAGSATVEPRTLSGYSGDFRNEFSSAFFKQCKVFGGQLMKLQMPREFPRFKLLMLRSSAVLRSTISDSILINLEWQRRIDEIVKAPDPATAISLTSAAEVYIEAAVMDNPISAIAIPAFGRAAMNVRARVAQATVLRGACMMRLAELRANADTPMPATLEELCKRTGKIGLVDPLAAKSGDLIIYKPNFADDTYTLTHNANHKPYDGSDPYLFSGRWTPGLN